MVKVLHLFNGADLGGISSMILNYYQHMDHNKIHFDFVSPLREEGINGKKLQEMGCQFYYIPKKSDGLLRHIRELDGLMKKEKYDAIHVHSNHTSYVGLMVAWKNGIKIRVAHGHNAVKGKLSLKGTISRRVGIILIRIFATDRLACSKDSAIYTFGKHSLREKSMQILPNAIDIEKYSFNADIRRKMRREFGLQQDIHIIGCVGRMSREKNHIFLIHLLPEIINRCPNAKLLLVGDGDEKKTIETEANSLGVLDSVIFTGARSDVPEILNVMDVFAFPSLNEGLGIAAIEAAASGLQVLMSEYIPTELGFIPDAKYISLDREEEWAVAIEEATKVTYENQSTDRTARSIQAAKLLSEKGYNIEIETKKLEAIYNRVGVKRDYFTVGTVGRMSAEKNQVFLIYVFNELLKIKPDSRLVLVGSGDCMKELKQVVSEFEISDKVLFTGNRLDIPDILNIFDVFVMPSVYEGFPIAGIEAASNGLPLVLSDTITRELEPFENVKYVSLKEDYSVWVEAILSFQDNERDSKRIDKVASCGYGIGECANKLAAIYQRNK